eukprot:CAMPEP_0176503560 /NCGR_PEP_ID=MMETSP0200_2-20121128/15430_1 /TAXON_ID=947934 /ORGANISM="Chaetoceros sp., Strain GSL56" /LENGTH=362 /DNA_ID=CAMNT_0017902863 /DNA_START=45 /DNA_END=1134 /DNA_ORIENTATION=+
MNATVISSHAQRIVSAQSPTSATAAAQESARKKLRCQDPDVTVAVGNGTTMQEFKCYRVVLSIASDLFDSMLSDAGSIHDDVRIEFPMKDPEEWKVFYSFIDPATHGKRGYACALFYEFKMDNLLHECDRILASDEYLRQIFTDNEFLRCCWVETRQEDCVVLFRHLSLCENYGLPQALPKAVEALAKFLMDGYHHIENDIVKIRHVISLVASSSLCTPLLKSAFNGILPSELRSDDGNFDAEILNNVLFPRIVQAGIRMQRRERESAKLLEGKNDDLERKILALKRLKKRLTELPDIVDSHVPDIRFEIETYFGEEIPTGSTLVSLKDFVNSSLKRILYQHLNNLDETIQIEKSWSQSCPF